jgi:hypothetical protein
VPVRRRVKRPGIKPFYTHTHRSTLILQHFPAQDATSPVPTQMRIYAMSLIKVPALSGVEGSLALGEREVTQRDPRNARCPKEAVILSARGPKRFLQFGGGKRRICFLQVFQSLKLEKGWYLMCGPI